MPIQPTLLGGLITDNISSRMAAIAGTNPLAQKNPAYFKSFCKSIATGLAQALPMIEFQTQDSGMTGKPAKPGIGQGVGIIIDARHMDESIYTAARQSIISQFGETTHSAYPPPSGNSGEYLRAVSEGVSLAIKTHFMTCWTLTSQHPAVYSGTGKAKGKFKPLPVSKIKAAIQGSAPSLKGAFWPQMCEAIAQGISKSLQTHADATLTIVGVCAPSAKQLCNIPGKGTGTGKAT